MSRRTPLLPVALVLMAGIATARLWWHQPGAWLWLTAASVALTGALLLFLKEARGITMGALLLAVTGVGGSLEALEWQRDWAHHGGDRVEMLVRLDESPQPRARSWRVRARALQVDGRAVSGEVTLYLRRDSTAATLRCGDRMLLRARPDRQRRSLYTTSDHYIVRHTARTTLRLRVEAWRMHLLQRMQRGPLERRHLGVAEAMTLGWRADMDEATRDAYRDAGIAHLLSVSGLHVGLLASLVGWLLVWAGRERRGRALRGGVQLVAVWLFALLTGLAPPTVRAALMFSLFIVSDIGERHTPRLNLLAAAAIATLLPQPSLLFNVGWQLSYSAVAGILLARPVIAAYNCKLWRAATVSVAATLACLPVTLAVFHRVPVYFLLANVVIVPLAGALLALSLAYLALPCGATAWPLDKAACAIDWVTQRVAALPGAVVETGQPTAAVLLALGVAVLALLTAPHWLRPKGQTS